MYGWNPNATYCPPPSWEITPSFTLYKPDMLLCAGLGILTGVVGCLSIRRARLSKWFVFSMVYLTFACMNTSGLLVWTRKPGAWRTNPDFSKFSTWLLFFDGTFSSSTSLNFFFAGLDLWGLFLPNASTRTKALVMFSSYATLFGLYYLTLTGHLQDGFHLLYVDVTYIGSTTFLVSSLLFVCKNKRFKALVPLLASFGIGIFGLVTLQNIPIQRALCHWAGGYFDGMSIWYIESDLSLILLLVFYYVAVAPGKKTDGYARVKSTGAMVDGSLGEPLMKL